MTTEEWTLEAGEGKDLMDGLEIAYEQCTVTDPELAESLLGMMKRMRVAQAITVTEHTACKDPEILVFNTGRPYAVGGQVISAKKVKWEDRPGVAFVDHARGIDGFIPHCGLSETNIMYHYDLGHYFGIWGDILDDLKTA